MARTNKTSRVQELGAAVLLAQLLLQFTNPAFFWLGEIMHQTFPLIGVIYLICLRCYHQDFLSQVNAC